MKITAPPKVWSKQPFDPSRDYKPGDSFVNEHGEHVLIVPADEMEAMLTAFQKTLQDD